MTGGEAAIRARLFDRDTRNVRLTAIGLELLPIARRVQREFHASLGELGQFVSGHRGRIVVGTLPSAGNSFLPAAIAKFSADNPSVDFSIRVMNTVPMLDAVAAGELDLGICLQPIASRSFRYEHLLDDPFHLVCAIKHPLALEGPSNWDVFAKYPYIAQSASTSIRLLTESTFHKLGLSVHISIACENLPLACRLIAAGVGISALPALALSEGDRGGLVKRALRGPALRRRLGIVTRIGRTPSPAARNFQTLLKSTIAGR